MPTRTHVLLATAAVLYAGGFATGLAGTGVWGWAAVCALLMLWTLLLRPAAQWSGPGAAGALRLLATTAVLAALAAVVWGAGRGLAALAGPVPLPVWAGPAAMLAAVGLGRAVWSGRREAEMSAFLDEALAGIAAQTRAASAEAAAGAARVAAEEEARRARLDRLIADMARRVRDGADDPGDFAAEIGELAAAHPMDEAIDALTDLTPGGARVWWPILFRVVSHPDAAWWAVSETQITSWLAWALGQGDDALATAAVEMAEARLARRALLEPDPEGRDLLAAAIGALPGAWSGLGERARAWHDAIPEAA